MIVESSRLRVAMGAGSLKGMSDVLRGASGRDDGQMSATTTNLTSICASPVLVAAVSTGLALPAAGTGAFEGGLPWLR